MCWERWAACVWGLVLQTDRCRKNLLLCFQSLPWWSHHTGVSDGLASSELHTVPLSLTWRCSLSSFLFPGPVPPVPICQGQEAPLHFQIGG